MFFNLTVKKPAKIIRCFFILHMHVYIYDSFVNQKKYDRVLTKIEIRLTDLGLSGKISRLGIMKSVVETVAREVRAGAKTVTAVGNDQTVNQVLNALAKTDVPLGIIPVGEENNSLARSLGIKPDLSACDTLAARRIERLDLGLANNVFFLTKAVIATAGTIIQIDDFSIEASQAGEINIINLATTEKKLPTGAKINPQDGLLELFIKTEANKKFFKKIFGQSVFSFKELVIANKNEPLLIDGSIKINTPAAISVAKQKINIIVGRRRNF